MTNTKKKKSAKEKRALVAALLIAAVTVAGSTFAWFTSTDTVTNRLSGETTFNVKATETFTPETTWVPGEDVNKDVSAVNVGTVEAYARMSVSGTLSTATDTSVAPASFNADKGYELATGEKEAIESNGQLVGTTADGITIYKRQISVDTNGTETYEYDGYYTKDSTQYRITFASGATVTVSDSTVTATGVTVLQKGDLKAVSETPSYAFASYNSTTKKYTTDSVTAETANAIKVSYTIDSKPVVVYINLVNDWTNNWIYVADATTPVAGKYVYKSVIASGSTSSQLIDSVTLGSETDAKFNQFTYDLDVTVEGAQAIKTESTYTGESVASWGVTVSDTSNGTLAKAGT